MSCQFRNKCPSYCSDICEKPNQDFSRCIRFLIGAVLVRDERIKELEERPSPSPEPRILYRCDRRACRTCNPECCLTKDIRHAENFELGPTGIFEEVSL